MIVMALQPRLYSFVFTLYSLSCDSYLATCYYRQKIVSLPFEWY